MSIFIDGYFRMGSFPVPQARAKLTLGDAITIEKNKLFFRKQR